MSGKASSTNLIDEGSPPALRTEARTVESPMFLRVLTATLLALQVGGRPDRVVPGDHAAVVGLVLAGGGDPVGHHLEGQPALPGDQQRGDVAEPELELAADHAGDDRRPALAGLQGQLDVAVGEEALLLAR
jgi:hypothetical protein